MTNLLPPKEKQILKEEKQFRRIILLLTTAGFFVVFLGLILLLIDFDLETRILVQEALSAQGKREVQASEIESLEQGIANFNQIFGEVNDFYKNQSSLTRIFTAIAKDLPEDSYLLGLEFQSKDNSIRVSGFTPTRESLIVFRENLKKDSFFETVDFPASNWVRAAEVEFFANLKVQENELKN